MNKEEFENEKDIEPYKTGKFSNIPSWVKILLLKYWAAGAAFYFAGVGSTFINVGTAYGGEVLLVWFTLLLALIVDYIVRPIVRLMRNSRDNTYYFNMINSKGILSLFLNILYAACITVPIFYITSYLVQLDIEGIFKMPNIFGVDFAWGLDPFFCGFLYIFFDFIYLFIKNAIANAIKKHKFNKDNPKTNNKEL